MGFEEAAISSIRSNRSLQRKQSAFYLPEANCIGKKVLIAKTPVDEVRMQKIASRSQLIEVIFYGAVLIFTLGLVYYFGV